ncbi:MAG: nickel-binding protein [Nitrososphaerales archaeon]
MPQDEFRVTHHDILYNAQDDKVYCVLDAPSKEAVRKHHENAGIKCDWIEISHFSSLYNLL